MRRSEVSQDRFDELLGEPLGEFYERSLTIFCDFGRHCSSDVTLILLYAVEQDKVPVVLVILEQHWEDYLAGIHPEMRGMHQDANGVNRTEALFYQIYQKVLGLDII